MKTETTTPGSSTTQSTTTHETTTHSSTVNPDEGKGVLITGGLNKMDYNATRYSAEIFLPNSPNTPCILPDLPAPFTEHTQNGGMLCGGSAKETHYICDQWNSEEGKFSGKSVHRFNPGRDQHVSWTPVSGDMTILFGGGYKTSIRNTTTILKKGNYEGIPGFNLIYPIVGACAIPDPDTDSVVITGGNPQPPIDRLTSVYNKNGFVMLWGNLNYRRKYHGCTSYVVDNERVNNFRFSC